MRTMLRALIEKLEDGYRLHIWGNDKFVPDCNCFDGEDFEEATKDSVPVESIIDHGRGAETCKACGGRGFVVPAAKSSTSEALEGGDGND